MTEPFVEISSGRLTAKVSSLGAELAGLRNNQGADFLWDGDPNVWAGRAPLLFPIVGSLNGGAFRFEGVRYELARHGFARRREFELRERAPDALTFGLGSDAETKALYPFDFDLQVTFSVRANVLSIDAVVENRDRVKMPTSFGFHPAFRWPLPGVDDRDGHCIIFAQNETGLTRRLDADGLLAPQPHLLRLEGPTLHLRDSLFADDAIVFDQLSSRRVSYTAASGPVIDVEFPGMPHLGLWSKPGAGFICIEPWQGYSDPTGFTGELTEKPGMVRLAPGGRHSFGMTIRLDQRHGRDRAGLVRSARPDDRLRGG